MGRLFEISHHPAGDSMALSATQWVFRLLRLLPKVWGGAVLLLLARTALGTLTWKNSRFIWLLKRNLMWFFVRVLPVPTPRVLAGAGATAKIATSLGALKCRKPLIVTDKVLIEHGLLGSCLTSLKAAGLDYSLYDGVLPDPPIQCVEDGYAIYREQGCDSLVAFGGGSVMDTAKMIGAKVVNPKPVPSYAGILKVNQFGLRPLPPFTAVPTTAGTGSEVSCGAVITDAEDNSKMVCIDLGLVPHYAVLDPELLYKLPRHITAATGMDALTHATEAYMNNICTSLGSTAAVGTVSKVFTNLFRCYTNGQDTDARQEMLHAAFDGGVAITNGHVAYVHAIAHQLGSLYHTPHGFACAIVLPHVLQFYINQDETLVKRLSELATAAGVCPRSEPTASGHRRTAENFLAKLKELGAKMGVPVVVDNMKSEDVAEVTTRALAEAHGSKYPAFTFRHLMDTGYPVPMYMSYQQCEEIVKKLLPAAA